MKFGKFQVIRTIQLTDRENVNKFPIKTGGKYFTSENTLITRPTCHIRAFILDFKSVIGLLPIIPEPYF